jgi:hypothetical protein
VICEAFDGDVPLIDADDAFHDADIGALGLKRATLFDV